MLPLHITQRSHIPDNNAFLSPVRGHLSVVLPCARTNLNTNPSGETNLTGYTATGIGSTFQSVGVDAAGISNSYHGLYGIAVSLPNPGATDGLYYAYSLTAGVTYAYSCKVKGDCGRRYKISMATTGGVDLTAYHFKATGRWQWVWGFWKETSTTTRRVYVTRDNETRPDSGSLYTDGWQLEVCGTEGVFVTTYIDGDQTGLLVRQNPPPYGWNGTPHASTSYRLSTTADGGRVLSLDRLNFKAVAIAGLGLTAVVNSAFVAPATDGALYNTTTKTPRSITVRGVIPAETPMDLSLKSAELYAALGPERVYPRQPLVLHYQNSDDWGVPQGSTGKIVASYENGLPQARDVIPAEEPTITFTQWLPVITTEEQGTTLAVSSSVANANGILQRSPGGVWSALGTGTNVGGVVRTILYATDGSIWAGGLFTSMGGVANTVSIARYVNGAWTALGTGATAGTEVREIVQGPDGAIYAVGTFTDMGGVANTARIAKWNGSAWVSITPTVANNSVSAAAFGPTGIFYVGGSFTAVNGVAANFVAQYDGTTWSALAGGPGANCTALSFGLDGTLYAAGTYVKSWNGSAWTSIETVANVQEVSVGPTGYVYGGGNFTSIGGVTTTSVARYNGVGWQAMASGLSPAGTIRRVATDPLTGQVFVAGESFTSSGLLTLLDPVARWNGAAWTSIGADLPSFPAVHAAAFKFDGTLTLGYSTQGTATVEGITTATNGGTARTYPTVKITGPSSGSARIHHLLNLTNGKFVFFNLTISAGETITIRMVQGGTLVDSNFRGSIKNAVLLGSSSDFPLEKGANTISLFAPGTGVTATMWWPTSFQTIDDLPR